MDRPEGREALISVDICGAPGCNKSNAGAPSKRRNL